MPELPRWGRLTMSATGVAGTALFLLLGFGTNLPMYGDSMVDYGRWASAHQPAARDELGLFLLTYVLYLVFGIYLAAVAEGRGPWSELLTRIALVAVGVRFAMESLQITILSVPASTNGSEFDASLAQLGSLLSAFSLFPNVMFLAAIGASGLASGAIPRWLAWFTAGVAAVQLTFMLLGLVDPRANAVLITFAALWFLSIPGWPLVAGVAQFVSAFRVPSPAAKLVPATT